MLVNQENGEFLKGQKTAHIGTFFDAKVKSVLIREGKKAKKMKS